LLIPAPPAPAADQPTGLSVLLGRLAHPSSPVSPGAYPIPPAPAVFDQRVVDIRAIGQEHIGNGVRVLVVAAAKLVGPGAR
jgi:hypothetical protein